MVQIYTYSSGDYNLLEPAKLRQPVEACLSLHFRLRGALSFYLIGKNPLTSFFSFSLLMDHEGL